MAFDHYGNWYAAHDEDCATIAAIMVRNVILRGSTIEDKDIHPARQIVAQSGGTLNVAVRDEYGYVNTQVTNTISTPYYAPAPPTPKIPTPTEWLFAEVEKVCLSGRSI